MTPESFVIQLLGWLIGLPLEFLVIAALFRGPYRRFPLVFLYALAVFVTTVVEIPLFTQSFVTRDAAVWRHAARVYWVNEWILEFLVFAVVISLVDQAASGSRWRRSVRAALAAVALLVAGISFWIEYRPAPVKYGYWMTPWTRDITFCAALLDVGLWMLLISSRRSDRVLFLMSSALGVQFTGEAIGEAIRQFSIPSQLSWVSLAGSVVSVTADMVCLYIWWQIFRKAPKPEVMAASK